MFKAAVRACITALLLVFLSNVALASFPFGWNRSSDRPEPLSEPQAESLTVEITASPAAYDRGLQAAQTAWQATGSAITSRNWQTVAGRWAQAAEAMQSVPTSDPRWILAQKKTREYLAGADYALDRAQQSPSPPAPWTFGNRVLDEKLALYQAHLAASGAPDLAIIGSSRALQGVDPAVLQQGLEQRGLPSARTLNLGINGATAQVVDRFVREILPSDQLPKRLIWADGVRAFNSGRSDRTDRGLRESPGYRALQQGKLTIQPDDIDGTSAIRGDGFLPIETRFSTDQYYRDRSPVAGLYDGDYVNFSLAGEQGAATQRLLDFAQARNISVTLVPLPLTLGYLDETRTAAEVQFRDFFNQLAQAYPNVTVADLPVTLPDRSFEDPSHLNRYGAIEVTRALARQL